MMDYAPQCKNNWPMSRRLQRIFKSIEFGVLVTFLVIAVIVAAGTLGLTWLIFGG
jgi:hypothetical protein